MKLLGWMHRKFRQNNGDAFKDFPTGTTCNCLSGGPSLDDHHQLSPVLLTRIHIRPIKDRHVPANEALLFEGLLSIGTLGSVDPIEEEHDEEQEAMLEPQGSVMTVETIAEKEETEEATETDLIVINTEIEKVLTEAAEKEGDRMSSARPSHISGKMNEACPLQEYLFRGVAAATEKEKKKKKRASLGELFMIEERGGGEGKEMKKEEKGKDSVNLIVKKTMKRSDQSHGNSHKLVGGGGGGAAADGGGAKVKGAKFQKIMQIFHKKIHAEGEMASKKSKKSSKYKSKYSTSSYNGTNCSSVHHEHESNALMTSFNKTCRGLEKSSSISLDRSGSTSSGEHWIKTDADYLVLELQNGSACIGDSAKEVELHCVI